MASQLELFLPTNYTTHLLSSIYDATMQQEHRGFGCVVNFSLRY